MNRTLFHKITQRFGLTLFGALALFVLFSLAGCSEKPNEALNSDPASNNQPTVEPSVADVKALILSDELQQQFPEQSRVWDELRSDKIVKDLGDPLEVDPQSLSDTYHDIYSVRVVWGALAHDSSGVGSGNVLDWSGGLTHNSAAMVVVNAEIDFEDNDSLFRTDPPGFGWVSHTSGDIDGVHFTVFHPKGIEYFAAPMFLFRTAQVKVEVGLYEFEDFDTVVVVDHENALAISAHRVRSTDCPGGHLAGEWIHKMRGEGYFFGRWIASDGQLMGHLSGEFTTADDGNHVFHGKWWDTEGHWQGYLHGAWGYTHDTDDPSSEPICLDCPDFVGWFRGKFTDTENQVRGRLGGLFGHGPINTAVDNHGGHFIGKWEIDCSDSPHD